MGRATPPLRPGHAPGAAGRAGRPPRTPRPRRGRCNPRNGLWRGLSLPPPLRLAELGPLAQQHQPTRPEKPMETQRYEPWGTFCTIAGSVPRTARCTLPRLPSLPLSGWWREPARLPLTLTADAWCASVRLARLMSLFEAAVLLLQVPLARLRRGIWIANCAETEGTVSAWFATRCKCSNIEVAAQSDFPKTRFITSRQFWPWHPWQTHDEEVALVSGFGDGLAAARPSQMRFATYLKPKE